VVVSAGQQPPGSRVPDEDHTRPQRRPRSRSGVVQADDRALNMEPVGGTTSAGHQDRPRRRSSARARPGRQRCRRRGPYGQPG
jgi:hypothetical protein